LPANLLLSEIGQARLLSRPSAVLQCVERAAFAVFSSMRAVPHPAKQNSQISRRTFTDFQRRIAFRGAECRRDVGDRVRHCVRATPERDRPADFQLNGVVPHRQPAVEKKLPPHHSAACWPQPKQVFQHQDSTSPRRSKVQKEPPGRSGEDADLSAGDPHDH
jgi:hypothetical protein